MTIGILGTKIGMTQVYDANGKCAPVTVIQAGPCPILQVRTKEKDGYEAIQVGYKEKSRKRATRAERGHVSEEMESKRRKRLPAGTAFPPRQIANPKNSFASFALTTPPSARLVTTLLLPRSLAKLNGSMSSAPAKAAVLPVV